jgi:hypothetical protein
MNWTVGSRKIDWKNLIGFAVLVGTHFNTADKTQCKVNFSHHNNLEAHQLLDE